MLMCHPDKKKGEVKELLADNSFLKNVKKAFEILGDPAKRKGYDSVDPDFDNECPSEKSVNKDNFFRVYGPVFERNARFSTSKNVPLLGDAFSSQEYVENFYEFWYSFDSWRDFSYEDEDKDGIDDKEERWYIDKQNKAERMSKKKDENARVRKLIDAAYHVDPRMKKFKKQQAEAKTAAKKAKQEEIYNRKRKEIEAQEKIEEEGRLKKEAEEKEAKAKVLREKKEKEAMKKELKVQRKVWLEMTVEEDYFVHDEKDRVNAMIDVDMLAEALGLLDLKGLIGEVTEIKEDKVESRKVIKQKVDDLKSGKIPNNYLAHMANTPVRISNNNNNNNSSKKNKAQDKVWSPEELQLLIKACNMFPAGTNKRWEVVAQYLSQHGPNKVTRPAKDVLNKAKELQSADATKIKEHAAADNLSQLGLDKKMAKLETMKGSSVNCAPTEKTLEAPVNNTPWSAEEQAFLEQALKTFPSSVADRWDKIAESIPGRTKKDCMKRYKDDMAEVAKCKSLLAKAMKKDKAKGGKKR